MIDLIALMMLHSAHAVVCDCAQCACMCHLKGFHEKCKHMRTCTCTCSRATPCCRCRHAPATQGRW